MRISGILVVWLGLAVCVQAQESFEAASIKPHPGIITFSADPFVKGDQVTAIASTLFDLIEVAYHARRDQILGMPGWADSEHYDLKAKSATVITTDQMRGMLQTLLADRFQLRIHHETRQVPTYALVVGKKGPQLKESSPNEAPKGQIVGDRAGGMHLEVAQGTMAQLASRLSSNGAGRPVVDKTGLTGIYSYRLDWLNAPSADSELPSLPVALQEQLGLRLEHTQGTSDMIIVEQVERPSAN